jgi:hypothetical protein
MVSVMVFAITSAVAFRMVPTMAVCSRSVAMLLKAVHSGSQFVATLAMSMVVYPLLKAVRLQLATKISKVVVKARLP